MQGQKKAIKIDLKGLLAIITALLATNIKKKKVVLQTYKAFLMVRKTQGYMGMVLGAGELFDEYVWSTDPVAQRDGPMKARARQLGVLFAKLTDEQARELDTFLTEQLAAVATDDSLEAYLVKTLGLENLVASPLLDIEDEDISTHVLQMALQAAFMSKDDEDEIVIRSNGQTIKDKALMGAICEFYKNQGYNTSRDGNYVEATKKGTKTRLTIYVTNMSWAPAEFGQIMITINRYSDGNE